MPSCENHPDRARMDTETFRKCVVSEWCAWFVEALNLGYVLAGEFRSRSSAQILSVRNWFEMLWTHARGVAAKMVKRQAGRDRSTRLLVAEAMRKKGALVSTYAPVAQGILRSLPNMAGRYVTAVALLPKVATPFLVGAEATRVSLEESAVFSFHRAVADVVLGDECGRLPAATLAKFFRHVGLLIRLAVGGGGFGRCPHSTGVA